MEISRRFSDSARMEMRSQIESAGGNEVFFAGFINESGVVVSVCAAARGSAVSVPVNYSQARKCSVLIHNHPSGVLVPSDADLAVASDCSQNAQGFYIINNQASDVYVVMEPVLPRVIKKLDAGQVSFLLSRDGPLAERDSGYEERPSQIELVRRITGAFNNNRIGVFEAGTGVGKSFSYLVPAMLWASSNNERVVISTGTINLQQQLVEKDIPLAMRITGKKIKAVLVKGRQNFICLRRLDETGKERDLFSEEQEVFDRLYEWSKSSKTGSRSDLSFVPPESIWQKVCSEADACMGMRCPFREKCFVMSMRKEAADANILVVNHHLLFADIESRLDGAGFEDTAVLPPYKRIVFDEAHGIEEAATSFFSFQVNRFKIQKQLNLMYRTRRGTASGFLFTLMSLAMGEDNSDEMLAGVERIKSALSALESEALPLVEKEYTVRLFEGNRGQFASMLGAMAILQKSLADFTGGVRSLLDSIPDDAKDSPVLYEAKSVLRRLDDSASVLGSFLSWSEHPDYVFWLQKARLGASSARKMDSPFYVQFIQTPLDIAPTMNKGVFESMDSVICTSATLSVGGSFDFWKRRTGLMLAEKDRIDEGFFPSPFPYDKNVLFAVARDAPFPDSPASFQQFVEVAAIKLIRAAEGRTLLLFTSYDSLRHAALFARTELRDSGINVLCQGDDDRARLLSSFKSDESSVLFATDSFWEGVDVPGSSLSQVIIVKLPFGVPSNPVFAARSERVQQRGGSPFMELSVPEAVIKFRQGFGRLIRRSSDKGAVVVLDRRIAEKQYGKLFTASIPETRRMYAGIDEIAKAVTSIVG